MNRVLSTLLCLFTLGAGAASAHAYVPEESKWNPSTLPIHYRINTGSIPSSVSSTGVASLDAGHATWAGPTCTAWRATDDGSTTSSANASDRQNVYVWLSGSWPADLGSASSVIGVTTPVWTVGGYFIDADIRFNNVGFTWSTSGAGGTVDTQSIGTHEEGHFLGLGHPPVPSAIMYASYSGGIKRALAADDQSGVCFLYPSGVAPTDAGVPPPIDAGGSTDRCTPLGGTCDTCTPNGGCGWCGATSRCITGTGTTAPTGCASGWSWYPSDCAGGSVGTGRFGDPCSGPTDCASGGECVSTGGAGFCSRACADDCGCPSGYLCVSSGSLTACVPGANACPPPPVDAGSPPVDSGTALVDSGTPPVDLGVTPPPMDLGTTPLTDGGMADADLGPGSHRLRSGACCSVPGANSANTQSGLASFALFAAVGVVRARRRRR